jgi:hypothetical protein
MEVNNTKAMQVLLNALNLKFKWDDFDENKIQILSSKHDLIYSIVTSEDEVQQIYKGSSEWSELIKLM